MALTFGFCSAAMAQTWGPGVIIDGSVDEWDGQAPAAVVDPSGDGGTGRDVIAIYMANDANNLYVRLQSANADAFDGNELTGIDGDTTSSTGFNLFGAGLGSDTLIAGASVFGETTASFNSGAATPSGLVGFGPFVASTDIEFAIDLSTTIPGDIAQSFPGGLGSTIDFVFGDSNGGATDVTTGTYTLATAPVTPGGLNLDEFDLFDTTANATNRTIDSSNAGFSVARDTGTGSFGPGLQATFTTAATAFGRAGVIHRFIAPVDITGSTNVDIEVAADAGNPVAAGQDLIICLRELDGDFYGFGAGLPTSTSFTTIAGPGAYGGAGWFLQGFSTGDGNPDPDEIAGWYIAVGESGTPSPGTFTFTFDNLNAPGAVPVELSTFAVE
jgi:hypothetical protein